VNLADFSVRAESLNHTSGFRIGIHLLEIICKMTSSDADVVRPILLNNYTIGSAIKLSLSGI